MRVTIDHTEIKRGMILKTTYYEVVCTVTMSEEQLQIIRDKRLQDYIVLERIPADAKDGDNPDWFTLRIKHLMNGKPDRFLCPDPVRAKEYEAELLDRLRELKAFLEESAEVGSSKVIEL